MDPYPWPISTSWAWLNARMCVFLIRLKGLLDREQRCRQISNAGELRTLMDTDLSARNTAPTASVNKTTLQNATRQGNLQPSSNNSPWVALAAFTAGVLLTIAIVKKQAWVCWRIMGKFYPTLKFIRGNVVLQDGMWGCFSPKSAAAGVPVITWIRS